MISFKGHYPLIYDADGQAVLFDPAWLRVVLEDAARRADYEGWWLVEDVALAVSAYLQQPHLDPAISLEEFERMMKHTLSNIGFSKMAGEIRMAHPVKQISLLKCLHEPPLKSEAEFYRRLQMTIDLCHRQGVQRLDLSGLSDCEAMLRSIHHGFPWQEVHGTREKIVMFVRRQIARLAWPQQFHCSIS